MANVLLICLSLISLRLVQSVNFTIESHPLTTWAISSTQGDSNTCITESQQGCDVKTTGDAIFEVKAQADQDNRFQDLLLYGFYATAGPGNYTTYTGDRKQLLRVLNSLNIHYDKETKGIVVVGLDISNDGTNSPHSLVPAVGASAVLKGAPPGFIYKGIKPQLGQEIIEGGSSFVTFANVDSGHFEVTIEPPPGMACALGPAGMSVESNSNTNFAKGEAAPDTITVLSFICL